MPRGSVRTGRLATVAMLLAGPMLLVLVGLVWAGELRPGAALVAALVGLALVGLLALRLLADVAALRRYAEGMADGRDEAEASGAPTGVLSDLTQAVIRARRAWSRERRELRGRATSAEAVLETLPDPVVLLDAHRRVVRATGGARALFGEAVAGRDLALSLRNPAVLSAVDAVIGGQAAGEVEFTMLEPVDRSFSVRLVRLPRPAADDTIVVATFYDLTDLRRSEQTRADFVANASHELRTPLSVLVGCIKTLRGAARDDPEAQARFLGMMEAQSDRMSRLVEDLLSLSRIELDEHRVPDAAVDVAKMVGQVADSMTFPANARGVEIVLEGIDELPKVQGDELQLTQLFQNLIDNAIKYGRPDDKVTVAGRVVTGEKPGPLPRDRAAIALSVIDRGEGIPPEHLPRLTERFYRVDTARSREMGGTGLGLAIVKHIVNRHRGHLAIDSVQGKGSTFTIFLPTAEPGGRDNADDADTAAGPAAAVG